jgi:hypothetical protein
MGGAPTLDPNELYFGCYNYDILTPLKVVRSDATPASDPGPVAVDFLTDDEIRRTARSIQAICRIPSSTPFLLSVTPIDLRP